MVFSSIPFLFYFLPIFFILYYLTPFSYKNGVLLFFSLIFYAWGEPIYVLLMIFETLSDFLIARAMEKAPDNIRKRKILLGISLFVDLSALLFFKYADFAIGVFNSITGSNAPLLGLGLPIGISFFTFQTLSYSIDVYKKKVDAEHSYINYLAYVSMFPQLIAGPIVRFSTIDEQLHSRHVDFDQVSKGFYRFLTGLFKKVLIANRIGALFEAVNAVSLSELTVADAWLGAIAYTFQIYFDFSAYSDMAIGMGQMMGFTFNENFNYPLTAVSITDFWRRWHISLSTWFRDYVYIPLGGNRTSKAKHIRNIFIVWFLTGFWHGASWNYMFWGLYYGIFLLLEKYVWGKYLEKLPKVFRHIYAYLIVVVSFVIFSHEDTANLGGYMKVMFGFSGNAFADGGFLWYLKSYLFIIILCILLMGPLFNNTVKLIYSRLGKAGKVICPVCMLALLVLVTAYLVNDSYNPFLYFRF